MQTGFDREPGVNGELTWIGARPSAAAIMGMLLVGTMGMLICGVQPVLLGALLAERRLSAAELGWATTAEFLTLGLAILIVGAALKPRGLRLKIAVAAIVTIAADVLVAGQNGTAVIVNRGVTGLAEGVLVWCAVAMIARSATPARWAGIFLTAQNLTQLLFAAAVPVAVTPILGANGGFYVMAATGLLALLACLFIPDSLADLPKPAVGTGARTMYSPAALASVLSVFLIAAFSIGLFAYLAPLAAQAGISGQGLGLIVSVVLATSTAGSALAAVVANRVNYFATFVVCLIVNAAVLVVLAKLPGLWTFTIAAGVFGFFWLFFLPFQLPFVIESDPTRRIAVIVPGAQLLGGAAGPLLCSFFVTDADARGALAVCAVCFAVAFLISVALHIDHLRKARGLRLAAT
jgi:MFS family permease